MHQYFDRLNHEFGGQKHQEEHGVDSGNDTTSESGLDSLLDYNEVEASVHSIPGRSLAGERPSACC